MTEIVSGPISQDGYETHCSSTGAAKNESHPILAASFHSGQFVVLETQHHVLLASPLFEDAVEAGVGKRRQNFTIFFNLPVGRPPCVFSS